MHSSPSTRMPGISYNIGGNVQVDPFFGYMNGTAPLLSLDPYAWHYVNFTTSPPVATVAWTPGMRHVCEEGSGRRS